MSQCYSPELEHNRCQAGHPIHHDTTGRYETDTWVHCLIADVVTCPHDTEQILDVRPGKAPGAVMSEMSPEAREVSAMFDDLKRKTDAYYAFRDARIAAEEAFGQCPHCHYPLTEHIGGKPCISSGPLPAPRGLYDLPIFGWAWQGDAKDKRA